MTTRATCHGSLPTQEVFQFDVIMDVRVAAVSRDIDQLALAPACPAGEVQ